MKPFYYYIYITLICSFLLGIKDGYIALWRDGCNEPIAVFPYRAHMLPEADKAALEDGITVTDELQLQQLLEDYLS